MDVAVETLGCRANQADSEKLINQLAKQGHSIVPDGKKADLYILNTCSVTTGAEAKARKLIRRQKKSNPGVRIIFTGCYAELAGEEIIREVPEIDEVVPGSKKESIPEIIGIPAGDKNLSAPGTIRKNLRTRKLLKIQDGCREFCTYCIVPRLRGELESKPLEKVLARVKRFVDEENYREIVFTGIHLGQYGRDLGENNYLENLVKVLEREYGGSEVRFRFSSLEPQDVSEKLVDLIADSSIFCSYLHLPLQSGSDKILNRMGRNYSAGEFQDLINYIKSRPAEIALGTDVMVGFPGESHADFEETYELLRENGFFNVHVFRYSERPKTPAAEMDNKVHSRLVTGRSKKLRNLAEQLKNEYAEKLINRSLKVLVEDNPNGRSYGYSERYFPVSVDGSFETGKILRVRTQKYKDGNLLAEVDKDE